MRKHTIGAVAVLLSITTGVQAGLFDAWRHNARLSFPGYTRAEPLTNFPFLVRLQDGVNGFSYSALASPADGADLRFASSDGWTELPYEIENWDTTGVSAVWVRASQITGAQDTVWAFWGRDGQAAPAYTADGSAWSDGFKAVYHMSGTNAAGGMPDALGGSTGTLFNVTGAVGRVGGAFGFNGSNALVNCGDVNAVDGLARVTMELWIRPRSNSLSVLKTFFRKDQVLGLDGTTARKPRGLFYSGAWKLPVGTVTIDDGNWHHLAGVFDGATCRLYVDGLPDGSPVAATAALGSNTNALYVGWSTFAPTVFYDGLLDEMRVASVSRSSNWVWASWLNQASNSSFLAVVADLPLVTNTDAANVLDTSADAGGVLTATGGSPASAWVFWDTADHGRTLDWPFATNLGVRAAGAVTAHLENLLPNRTYFYTYAASNAAGVTIAGPSPSFETRGPPRVDNGGGADGIGYTNAILRGTLADGIEAEVTLYWGQESGSLTNVIPLGSVVEGPFASGLPVLQNDAVFYYRCYASNAYGDAWSAVTNFTTPVKGLAWTGGGTNALASNTNNWQGNVCPANGDSVFLDGTGVKSMTWDLTNVTLRSWNQEAGYTGTVTITTRYPGLGAFTNMILTGNCKILGGAWTHPANTGGGTAADRLTVSIGGDLFVGTNGQIHADVRGYAIAAGPGAAESGAQLSRGASHGGLGGQGGNYVMPAPTYGSFARPFTLGSGGSMPGGGSLRLVVGGTTRVEGLIQANGSGVGRHAGSTGGSIWLTTARLEGGGAIRAQGGGGTDGTDTAGAGGGGRVAVYLTAADDFGNVAISAPGGKGASAYPGASGTVYLQAAGQDDGRGVLVLDGSPYTVSYVICTRMPEPSVYNEAPDLTPLSAIVITNGAVLWLNTNTVYDFAAANIRPQGKVGATVVVGGTNALDFPGLFVYPTNYTLLFAAGVREEGDWVIPSGAVMSHFSNYRGETFKLDLSLNGNLTVEAGGSVSVEGRGYVAGYGPAGSGSQYGYGASYGGMGGLSYALAAARGCYGSVTAPTNFGSAGYYAGNGAMQLDIRGTTTVYGVLMARQTVASAGVPGSSGGSIWLRSGWLSGTGLLDAAGSATSFKGSAGYGSAGGGGGGRIAVVLAEGDSFDGVRMNAAGGINGTSGWSTTNSAAAGTVFTQTRSQGARGGRLLVANANTPFSPGVATNTLTMLPAGTGAGELSRVTLVVSNRAQVGLSSDLAVGDLFLIANASNDLYLKGYTLTVNSRYHPDWGSTNDVIEDGGRIVWGGLQRGSLILIR